jgi:hypothetical protein
MFKRSRRSILCHVEQLEGRAAASTVVESAVVIGTIEKVVHLRGYTTNTSPGRDLYIQATQHISHTTIQSYTTAVVNPSGSFYGSVHAKRPWHIGGELTVDISVINPPESLPSSYFLATEHIRITLD